MTNLNNTVKYVGLFLLSIALVMVSCEPDPEPGPDIYDTLSALSGASSFIEAMNIAEFDDDLKSGQLFTLFVPTDEAFDNFLSDNGYATLNDVPIEDLRNILRYHILGFASNLPDLGNNYHLTVSGAGYNDNFLAILILNPGPRATINTHVEVISQDNEVNGSYFNTIGEVLSLPTNLSVIRQNEVFSQFAEGISRVEGLSDSLSGEDPYTIFVATDAKVETALEDRYGIDDMADLDLASVDSLMKFHIIRGNNRNADLVSSFNFEYETLLPDQPVEIRGGNETAFVNAQTSLIFGDIQTTNGVVHILNELLEIEP